MTENITNDLIYEVLKDIQKKQSNQANAMQDLKTGQIQIREDINNVREDINNVRGDMLRHEKQLSTFELRLEAIETRLGLNETTQ